MYRRFWLNKGRGVAFMVVDVKDEVQGKKYVDIDVTISDCSRQIALDFAATKANKNERLRKLRGIIKALQEVEQVLANYKFGKGRGNDFD